MGKLSKAIFITGPSGSGKSTLSKELLPNDWEIINVDIEYEKLLNKSGIGTDIKDFNQKELSKAGEFMSQARKNTEHSLDQFSKEGKNLIIDGTGASSKTLLKKKEQLESLGYETFMVMIWVTPYTALERNQNRERSLKPFIILKTWRDVINNIGIYKNEFKNNFTLINNDSEGKLEFDYEYVKQAFPSQSSGKTYTPEESAKLQKDKEKLHSDITSLLSTIPEFESLEQVKSKINTFINEQIDEVKLVSQTKIDKIKNLWNKITDSPYWENLNHNDQFEFTDFWDKYPDEWYKFTNEDFINLYNDINNLYNKIQNTEYNQEEDENDLDEVKLVKIYKEQEIIDLIYEIEEKFNYLRELESDDREVFSIYEIPFSNQKAEILYTQYKQILINKINKYLRDNNYKKDVFSLSVIPHKEQNEIYNELYNINVELSNIENNYDSIDEIKKVPLNQLEKEGYIHYGEPINDWILWDEKNISIKTFEKEYLNGKIWGKGYLKKDEYMAWGSTEVFYDDEEDETSWDFSEEEFINSIATEDITKLTNESLFTKKFWKENLFEVKLIPHNRILLKNNGNNYYFEIEKNNKRLIVGKEELNNGIVIFSYYHINLDELSQFLDSKKIKYKKNINYIYINAKYFITPDPINEIKLIPHNRILLKNNGIYYYFEANNEQYRVYNFEIIRGTITFSRNSSELIQFLNSKNIKYIIYDDYDIHVDVKYFILPDSINEIKKIQVSKNIQYILNIINSIGSLININQKLMIDENNKIKKEYISIINKFLNTFTINYHLPTTDTVWHRLDILDKNTENPQVIEFFNQFPLEIQKETIEKLNKIYDELSSQIQSDQENILNESKVDKKSIIKEFLKDCIKELDLKQNCKIILTSDKSKTSTYAHYDPQNNEIVVYIKNRSLGDILRSICHELVHHKQNQNGELKPNSGKTGSEQENEANSKAGILLRNFGKKYPQIFESKESNKSILNEVKLVKNPNFPFPSIDEFNDIDSLLNIKKEYYLYVWKIIDKYPNISTNILDTLIKNHNKRLEEFFKQNISDILDNLYNKYHDEKLEFKGKIGSPFKKNQYVIHSQGHNIIKYHNILKSKLPNFPDYGSFYIIYNWDPISFNPDLDNLKKYIQPKHVYLYNYNNTPLILVVKQNRQGTFYDHDYEIYTPNGYITLKNFKSSSTELILDTLELNQPLNEVKLVKNWELNKGKKIISSQIKIDDYVTYDDNLVYQVYDINGGDIFLKLISGDGMKDMVINKRFDNEFDTYDSSLFDNVYSNLDEIKVVSQDRIDKIMNLYNKIIESFYDKDGRIDNKYIFTSELELLSNLEDKYDLNNLKKYSIIELNDLYKELLKYYNKYIIGKMEKRRSKKEKNIFTKSWWKDIIK